MGGRHLKRLHWLLFAGLALCLAGTAEGKSAKDQWWNLSTEHLNAFGDASPKEAEAILKEIETLGAALRQISSGLTQDTRLPVQVVILKGKSFTALRKDMGIESGNTAGFFFSGPLYRYIVVDADEPGSTPLHEYTHNVVDNNHPDLPLWMDEGVAELYSTFEVRKGDVVIGTPIREHVALLREQGLMPLKELFGVDRDSGHYNESDRQGQFYAQSWLVVHYLFMENRNMKTGLGAFLQQLGSGVDPAVAVPRAFGIPLSTFEDRMQAYLKQDSYRFLRYEGLEIPAIETSGKRLLTPQATRLQKALLLSSSDLDISRERAKTMLVELLEYPEEKADAAAGLGFLLSREDRFEEAQSYLNMALAAGSRSPQVCFLHGLGLYELVKGDALDQPAQQKRLQDTRKSLRCALQGSPDWPEALAALGYTYGLIPGEDVQPGIDALTRSVAAMPETQESWVHLTQLYVQTGQADEARRAAARAQRGQDRTLAQYALDATRLLVFDEIEPLLEEGNLTAALEKLGAARQQVKDADIAAMLDAELERLMAAQTGHAYVDLFNRAVTFGNQGEFQKARDLYSQVAQSCPDPELKAEAQMRLKELDRVTRGNRDIETFNRAIEIANTGDLHTAITMLSDLEQHTAVPELKRDIGKVLGDMRTMQVKQQRRRDFNRALELIDKGSQEEAVKILRPLAALEDDQELAKAAGSVLGSMGK